MKEVKTILDDPIKATLFGKFYERIVLKWFEQKKGFVSFKGKPRIYWQHVKPAKGYGDGIKKINKVLKEYKKENQYCTPDGFLQKSGKFYIWEAKNWPLWTQGMKPLDQISELLYSMPLILSAKADFRGVDYKVDGILFSWWVKPDGINVLLKGINKIIAPRTFEMFYTAEVLADCIANKYPWYSEIIKEEKEKIDEFFEDLIS